MGTRPGLPCPWGQGDVLLAGRSAKGTTFKYTAAAAPPPGSRPAALAGGAAEVVFPYTVTGEPLASPAGEFLLPCFSEKSFISPISMKRGSSQILSEQPSTGGAGAGDGAQLRAYPKHRGGGGVRAWFLASKSLRADGAASDGCTQRSKSFGSPPTPACTYTLPLPALIPSGAERVPGSFGLLPQASERLLCLHHRGGSCQGSLKVPPAGFGPGTLCRPLGLQWEAIDNLARAEERVGNREQPPGNGRHAIPCRLVAPLTQVSPCPCPPGAVLHIGVLHVVSGSVSSSLGAAPELLGPAAGEPLCQMELGVRNPLMES